MSLGFKGLNVWRRVSFHDASKHSTPFEKWQFDFVQTLQPRGRESNLRNQSRRIKSALKRAIGAIQHRTYQFRDSTVTTVTPRHVHRDAYLSKIIACTQQASTALKFWACITKPSALSTNRIIGCLEWRSSFFSPDPPSNYRQNTSINL